MGTAGYMSPEQVRGEPVDQRSDIFSFGAVLYEALSGRRAFHGDSAIESLNAILKENRRLQRNNYEINPQLEKVVRRCLEKKPERRFHSTHDLSFALEACSAYDSSKTEPLGTYRNCERRFELLPQFASRMDRRWILSLLTLGMAWVYFSRQPPEQTPCRKL